MQESSEKLVRLTAGKWIGAIGVLLILLVGSIGTAIIFGSERLHFRDMAVALDDSIDAVGFRETCRLLSENRFADPHVTILFGLRLPRALLAVIVGATLATAGVAFQGLLRNPLADPFILGISGGAALGAVCSILTGFDVHIGGFATTPIFAFLGALASMFLVYFAAGGPGGRVSAVTLLLTGVILNFLFSAIIMLLTSLAASHRKLDITNWLMGTIMPGMNYWQILGIGLLGMVGLFSFTAIAANLNLLSLGEGVATGLGVNVGRTKTLIFIFASLMTGVAVSVSGPVGFVGLIIPHIMRFALGPDHRLLLPASFLLGGAFLALADTAARTAFAPEEIPVGVMTALCGSPFFLWLLRSRYGRAYF
jgi:iron complex transport system permease protein